MRLAEVIDHDVECGEEGVHIEHEESVPFPVGSVGKPTLRCGHLPFKSSPVTHTKRFEGYGTGDESVRDILVCTHGANDVCCGKFGYPLYNRLRLAYAAESGGTLRVWRTSHIGGHRFAATMIDFPEGRYWGHLGVPDAERVVLRDVPVADLSDKCRGWAALDTNFEQIAERAAFVREGWAWTEYLKSAEVLEKNEDGARIRLDYHTPDGRPSGAYEAGIEPNGSVMTLGKSGDGPLQEVPQYRVSRLDRMPRQQSPAGTPEL